jgi:DNA helicase MCM9
MCRSDRIGALGPSWGWPTDRLSRTSIDRTFDSFGGRQQCGEEELYGLFLVKLAGDDRRRPTLLLLLLPLLLLFWFKTRGECHLLLVGSTDTGMNKLLKLAAPVSPCSILTTGIGTTSAGLSVTTWKEHGDEWGWKRAHWSLPSQEWPPLMSSVVCGNMIAR